MSSPPVTSRPETSLRRLGLLPYRWWEHPPTGAPAEHTEEILHGDITAHRVVTILAASGLFGAAFASWSAIIQVPLVGVVSVVGFGVILATVLIGVIARTEKALQRIDLALLIVAVLLLAAWAASQLYFYPAYGTDEAAFEQYAAQLLIHGHNPYVHSMLPALTQFRVPIQFATNTLNGSVSSTFAYPSLAFLLGVPFVLITHGVQSIIVGNMVFLAIEMVLVFLFVPRSLRALAPLVVVGLPILFGYTVAGINDTLLVPFLLVVAWRWSDVGRQGRLGRSGVARAACLGLALSIQQLAWLVFPFVLLGLWCLRSDDLDKPAARRLTGRYAAAALATFALVNGPFIAWGPRAWYHGVLTPFTQHAIPYGQGLIDASVFFKLGGGHLSYYTDAALGVLVTVLVVYRLYFRRLWRVAFILPSVVLFFPTRSLAEYFMTVIGVWVVSIVSPGDGPRRGSAPDGPWRVLPRPVGRTWSRLHWRPVAAAVSVVPAAIFLALALTTPGPLTMQIRSVETNGQLQGVWRMKVLVTNRSGVALQPHFAANYIGQMTSFWYVTSGPRTLKPRARALYTLAAPNVGSMPGITQPFTLQAVSANPDSISSTNLYTPQQFSCYISPSYFDNEVPLGRAVTLRVQLRSPFGATVTRAGVRVALGQLIYGQLALIPAEAVINGAPEGQTPVVVRTSASGVASFTVRDDSTQNGNPVYFQAYVDPVQGYPYGYSEIVSILWR